MLFFGPPLEVAKSDFLNLANVLMSPRFDSNILIFIVNYDSTLINNNLFNNQSNEMKMHLLKVIFNCPYFLTIPMIINVSKMQIVGPWNYTDNSKVLNIPFEKCQHKLKMA